MHISSSARPVASSPGKLRQFLQRYPLLCYFVMAYGFSWLSWLPYVLAQDGLGLLPVRLGQIGIVPGAFLGPILAGFLMAGATEGKPGVKHMWRRMVQWRVAWYWYLVPLLCIPIFTLLGFFTMPGAIEATHPVFPQLVWIFPVALILEIFTSGLAEEPGWRGFALPRLQERFGPLLGTIILGVLWQCWHLPLYLTDWGRGAGWLSICIAIIGNIGISILITWVFNNTQGSLFMAILMHAALDAFGVTLATSFFSLAWLEKNAELALLIGFGVISLLLVIMTRGRLSYRRTSALADVTMPLDKREY
jgi:membrane protease YdiL (CAAX protease family)